jgi:hypothetical protein
MQALESTEQLVRESHIESGAVVAHKKHDVSSLGASTYLHNALISLTGKFYRVLQQVHPDQPQHFTIAVDGWQRSSNQLQVAPIQARCKILQGSTNEIVHQRDGVGQRPSSDAGELQYIGDETSHPLRAVTHNLQEPPPLLIQPIAIILLQDGGETIDGPQRCTQIVGHGIGERLKILVG